MFVIPRHSFFLHLYLVSLDLPLIVNTTHTRCGELFCSSFFFLMMNSSKACNACKTGGWLGAEPSKIKPSRRGSVLLCTNREADGAAPPPQVSKAPTVDPQQLTQYQ